MRKLFLGAIIAFMSSCTSMRYSEKTYVNDYTKYVNEGFYIYPSNAVPSSLSYTPISEISIIFSAGKPGKSSDTDGLIIIKQGDPNTFADYAIASPEYMVDRLVEKAKTFGANAIINLKGKNLNKDQYIIEGIAVKLEI